MELTRGLWLLRAFAPIAFFLGVLYFLNGLAGWGFSGSTGTKEDTIERILDAVVRGLHGLIWGLGLAILIQWEHDWLRRKAEELMEEMKIFRAGVLIPPRRGTR